MSQLKPKRIVLHCGLHKTGSTYVQGNLQRNRLLLRKQGVLFLGPNTFKKRCPELWRYLQWGETNSKTAESLQSQTRESLLELAGNHREEISTIVFSCEAFFGTLRNGFTQSRRQEAPNNEGEMGLYRYAKSRTQRLINGLEDSLGRQSIEWTVLFASRNQEDFIRSCHTQLIKQGIHTPEISDFDTFRQTADFSHTDRQRLEHTLSELKNERNLSVVTINYEQASNPKDPSSLLWNVLRQALPDQADLIRQQLEANADNKLDRTPNPGLNERGLSLALQARTLFSDSEWKLFRKFLEKNFAKTP